MKEAAERAASAMRAAQAAQARAASAHRRAVEELENAGAEHEHAAEVAAADGAATTAERYRELAALAREEAQRARAREQAS